jgi:hypothetical protein
MGLARGLARALHPLVKTAVNPSLGARGPLSLRATS